MINILKFTLGVPILVLQSLVMVYAFLLMIILKIAHIKNAPKTSWKEMRDTLKDVWKHEEGKLEVPKKIHDLWLTFVIAVSALACAVQGHPKNVIIKEYIDKNLDVNYNCERTWQLMTCSRCGKILGKRLALTMVIISKRTTEVIHNKGGFFRIIDKKKTEELKKKKPIDNMKEA